MYKILVVEDDSRLNQAVCNFLNGSGYAAAGVPHALAAYDAIYHTKFDLIISDIMMPEVDGFEFAQTVRQSDQTTPTLFAIVIADGSIMEIVWNNLLSNAIKFTEYGGQIMLTQHSDNDSVTISVEDNGCGMDGSTIKHIFEKFYRGDAAHSQEGYGLGAIRFWK